MPNITPIPLKPTSGVETRLKAFMKRRIMAIRQGCQVIHEDRVVNWRKAYEAIPVESVREFPFYNASNNVIPIIAIHSDTLLARVMSAVLKTQPPWVAQIYGEHIDARGMDERRAAVEELMTYAAIEPSELDLFRVYHEWFGETIRYGTSVVKCPQVKVIEASAYMAGDGSGKTEFEDEILYKGPCPEKVRFPDFGIRPLPRHWKMQTSFITLSGCRNMSFRSGLFTIYTTRKWSMRSLRALIARLPTLSSQQWSKMQARSR